MNFLAKFFLENHKFTLVVSLFVMIFGVFGVMSLKSESFPSVNLGAVVITTRYDGATADDIETKITKPIEEEIQRVTGLKQVKSTSQAGLSTIVTEVDIDKYNTEDVIADLQRAVDRAAGLPPDLETKPVFTEIKSDEFPVIELAVIGSNEGRKRDAVADLLKEELKDNKKVSAVTLIGFRERQFNLLLNRQTMENLHVSIAEVEAALRFRNITIPGGEIRGQEVQKLIRIEGKASSAAELEKIVVRSNFSGQKILLQNIATVEDSSEEPLTLFRYNGEPATRLIVTKKGGADLLALSKEVSETLDLFSKKYSGEIEFKIFSNEGVRVADRLGVLISNGWQGLVLVLVFLMLFLPGRVGIMTAFSLPLALASTMGLVMVMGYTLNTITIIAFVIALGMLVDNAVVIAENYTRLRDEGLENNEALLKTVHDLWAPITATALTTIAAFLPMLVTSGVMGQFIKAIPIVVTLALALSLAESFFLLPMRLKLFPYVSKLKNNEVQSDWFTRKVIPPFEKIVTWGVDNKWKSTGIYIALFIGTIMMLAFGNRLNLFPAEQTEIYVARLEAPKGTRVESTDLINQEVQKQILDTLKDRALHVTAVAGDSAMDNSDPKAKSGSNVSMINIFVSKETQDKVSTKEILDQLREIKNEKLSSLSFEAMINGPPVGDPVSVTLRSNDLQQVEAVAQHLKNYISQQKGIFDAQVDDVFGDDEINVIFDYEKVARLGLNLQSVGQTVRTAIAGQKVGDVNLNNREVDYFLRFDDQDKASIESLQKLMIPDPSGNLIPLSNIAKFEQVKGRPQVKRYDFRRAKTVIANLDDTVITSIQANQLVAEEFKRIQDQYKDVSLVLGGEAEKTNESVGSLFGALILSLIAIFALLVLMFKSYINPIIILTTIPLGLVGVSISFFIHQKPLSFMALIGVIGLGGIIVNSGIILISFINQMREETQMSLRDILIKSSTLRLRSVLVTSLTTISGLVPTAYGIGGSDYFIIPMAMALAWGLTTGTILTLIWVPPAYAVVEESLEYIRNFANKKLKSQDQKKEFTESAIS